MKKLIEFLGCFRPKFVNDFGYRALVWDFPKISVCLSWLSTRVYDEIDYPCEKDTGANLRL